MEGDNSWGNYPLRSNGVDRIIWGAALALYLTLWPIPGQAQAGSRVSPSGDATLVQGWMEQRYAQGFGVSETPAMQVNAPQDGRGLMASLPPLRPADRLPHFTSPLPIAHPQTPPQAPLGKLTMTHKQGGRVTR